MVIIWLMMVNHNLIIISRVIGVISQLMGVLSIAIPIIKPPQLHKDKPFLDYHPSFAD